MEEFDVIVVGGGISGLICAYTLAQKELSVVLFERADIGTKNVSGGRLYAHTLRGIEGLEDFDTACERAIVCEKLGFMDDESTFMMESRTTLSDDKFSNSYSVLQNKFLNYLSNKCEELGVMVASNVLVDDLLVKLENGEIIKSSSLNRALNSNESVVGIQAGEDEMNAKYVVLAEGLNSLLAQSIDLHASNDGNNSFIGKNYALGIKEVIELPVSSRFALNDKEGLAALYAGKASDYLMGGGFLYTNENTISLGCVIGLGRNMNKKSHEIFEDFKNHPSIAPIIKDGKTLEYSAKLVPEGGFNAMSKLGANGVLVVGDAAGFCMNLGYTVRGMDLAIMSAKNAALAISTAISENKNALEAYKVNLEKEGSFLDFKQFNQVGEFLEHNERMFNNYPKELNILMKSLFKIDGKSEPIKAKVMRFVKSIGIMNLIKDTWKGSKVL